MGYFTVKIDFFKDAPQQIEGQLNSLFGAYYAYIYESLYHNLEKITKIPAENPKFILYQIKTLIKGLFIVKYQAEIRE